MSAPNSSDSASCTMRSGCVCASADPMRTVATTTARLAAVRRVITFLHGGTFAAMDRCETRSANGSPSAAIAFAIHDFVRLMDLLPLPFLLGGGRLVVTALLVRRLAQQPPVVLEPIRVQLTALDRGTHRASGLALVRAVGEPAARRERRHIRERRVDRLFTGPRLQLA